MYDTRKNPRHVPTSSSLNHSLLAMGSSRRSASRSRTPPCPSSPPPRRPPHHTNAFKTSASPSPSRSRSTSPTAPTPLDVVHPVHLRVENLTRNVQADHLREIFGKFGLVVRVAMATPRGKASAVVVLATQEDADRAKEHMHEGWLDGNKLRVLPDVPVGGPAPATDHRVHHPSRRTGGTTRASLSPNSRNRPRGGRFRSPVSSRGRYRSPPRGGRGRRGPSPFRGRSRSRSFNTTRRGARSRSPAFRRRAPSPFRSGRRSPLPPFRGGGGGGGRRRSPSPFRRRRSPSRSRSRSRSFSRSRSRSRSASRSRSRSRGGSSSSRSRSRSRSSSRGRRHRSSRSRSSRSRS